MPSSLAFLLEEEEEQEQEEEELEEGECSKQVQEVQEEEEEEGVTLSRVADPRVPEVVEAALLGPGVSKVEEEEEGEAKEVAAEGKGVK